MINYGVLKGRVVRGKRWERPRGKPHYHLVVQDDQNEIWRCPVNVQSDDGSKVWCVLTDPLLPTPLFKRLHALPYGLTKLRERQSGLALDFVREPLFDPGSMRHLPHHLAGPDNDAEDGLQTLVDRLAKEEGGYACVFGSYWLQCQLPPTDPDLHVCQGMHNVHMNQGSGYPHKKDNGIFQDGAVLAWLPSMKSWIGYFVAFDSQSWQTDDNGCQKSLGLS